MRGRALGALAALLLLCAPGLSLAQFGGGPISIPGLPLSGGTLTGQLNVGAAVGQGGANTGCSLAPSNGSLTCGRTGNTPFNNLVRTDATLSSSTTIGNQQWLGNDASGVATTWASVQGVASVATDGGQTGQINLRVANGAASPTTIASITNTGFKVASGFGLYFTNLLSQATAPTISSGFGASASVSKNNGTAAFTINVGTGGSATNGVVGLPTAANGWACDAQDLTTQSSTVANTKQIASTTTSATLANFNTSMAQAAWAASDTLSVKCTAY